MELRYFRLLGFGDLIFVLCFWFQLVGKIISVMFWDSIVVLVWRIFWYSQQGVFYWLHYHDCAYE